MFCKDLFLALYFSLYSSMIFLLLYLFPSRVLFTLTIWSSSPSVPTAVGATQGALIQLEHWSEYWCLPLNLRKCEASFSVDLHQASLQPNLLLLGSRLCFNPTPTFLGVTVDCTLSFSKYVSSLQVSFSLISRPYAVSLFPHGAPLRSPSLFCIQLFFSPFSLTLQPDGFLS